MCDNIPDLSEKELKELGLWMPSNWYNNDNIRGGNNEKKNKV